MEYKSIEDKLKDTKVINPYPLYAAFISFINFVIIIIMTRYNIINDWVFYILAVAIGINIENFSHPTTIHEYYHNNYEPCISALASMATTTVILVINIVYDLPPLIALITYIGVHTVFNNILIIIFKKIMERKSQVVKI